MAVAQHIGFQCEELLEGIEPCGGVAVKFGKERRTDVLGEKYPLPFFLHVQGDRTGGMPGRMDPPQGMARKFEVPLVTFELYVDGKGFEVDVEAERRGEPYISPLDNFRILFVHNELCPEMRSQELRRADVIGMAVGHNEGPYIVRPKPRFSDIIEHPVKAMPRSTVDEDRFPGVDQVNGAVPPVRHVGTGHTPYHAGYLLRSHTVFLACNIMLNRRRVKIFQRSIRKL